MSTDDTTHDEVEVEPTDGIATPAPLEVTTKVEED